MPELELVEERLISGVGVLRVPLGTLDGRYYRLCIDVVREVPQPFESFKYTPSRSRYCTCSFMRDGYVVEELTVDYKKRCFDFVSDIAGQTLIAIKCMYKGLLETFVNLGNALNLAPFIIANNIEDYEHLNLFWDEVLITCESSTAVQVRLFILDHADDCQSSDPFRPPPPPNPLPTVPPGTSIGSISRPYDLDPFTTPNPLDEFEEEPPLGEQCVIYRVNYTLNYAGNQTLTGGFRIAGEYREDISVVTVSGQSRVFMTSRGTSSLFNTPPCGELENRLSATSSSPNALSVVITSITPV